LTVATIVGLLVVALAGRASGVATTGRAPGVSVDSRKPDITFVGEG